MKAAFIKRARKNRTPIPKIQLKKSKLESILSFSPAWIVAKFGWKAIKFIGKKIWQGIKNLAFKAVSFFAALFKLGGKFINSVASWVGRIGKGIKDKTYRFLVKPIATMITSIFSFVTGVVMSPIKFIKWFVPAVFDRILDALNGISQAVKRVLRSTWSIFKKILFNPITIALLVGVLFYFFGPKLLKWLTGLVGGIKDGISSTIVPIFKSLGKFLVKVWEVISTVGKFIFGIIEWITNPEGKIVKFVTFVVKMLLAVKGFIKNLMKTAGYDSIDVFCMFLAGDMIGVAIASIGGLVVKLWRFIKRRNIFRLLFGLVKAVMGMHAMILTLAWAFLKAVVSGGWKIIKFISGFGSVDEITEAFTKPFKDWWEGVKKIFSFAADDIVQPDLKKVHYDENPVE